MGQVLTLVQPPAHRPAIVFGTALTRRLAARAAELTGITLTRLLNDRDWNTAYIRFAVMLVARENGKTLAQIAIVFGKDHTTVLAAVHRAVQLEAEDPDFAMLVKLLREEAER